jgi:L-malate glycosyltransferase
MSIRLKILFFTPYSGRTGSEMFLWYMFKNMDFKKYDVMLISDTNAELLSVMPREVSCVVTKKYPRKLDRIKAFVYRTFGMNYYDRHILRIHKNFKPDFWYLNTVLMADKITLAKAAGVPVISHIHELMTDYSLVSKKDMTAMVNYSSLMVGDSRVVCESLRILGAKQVKLQYECIDHVEIKTNHQLTAEIKAQLGLGSYRFVWLMSGTSSVRKGTDMVCEIASELNARNMALLWIGNNSSTGMDFYIEQFRKEKGLNNLFYLGKKVHDYYSYMDVMDGFVLTSREEPFGMVVTEALALGKPVVAFNSGGVKEIIVEDIGLICESWNVPDLVAEMVKIAEGKISFSAARAKERARDFDVLSQYQNWQRILDDFKASTVPYQLL